MKKTKDLFLTTALICMFSTLLNIFYVVECISDKDIFGAIMYVIFAIVCLTSSVAFIFFKKQSDKYLLEHKQHIKIFSIIVIFCSLLAGIVAIYSYYSLLQNSMTKTNQSSVTSTSIDEIEVIDDKRMAKYIDDLNHLENMKNGGIISQDKYEELKKQILSDYLNKGD